MRRCTFCGNCTAHCTALIQRVQMLTVITSTKCGSSSLAVQKLTRCHQFSPVQMLTTYFALRGKRKKAKAQITWRCVAHSSRVRSCCLIRPDDTFCCCCCSQLHTHTHTYIYIYMHFQYHISWRVYYNMRPVLRNLKNTECLIIKNLQPIILSSS